MVSLSRLSDPQAVQSAIEEFYRLGRESFRKAYRGGKSRDYVAVVDGDIIDSKPLAASAYRHQTNISITCRDFSGGEQTRNALKPLLEKLGHSWMTVEEAHQLLATPLAEGSKSREILSIDEILDRYHAIETEHEMIAESDDELLLLGFAAEGHSQLDIGKVGLKTVVLTLCP